MINMMISVYDRMVEDCNGGTKTKKKTKALSNKKDTSLSTYFPQAAHVAPIFTDSLCDSHYQVQGCKD